MQETAQISSMSQPVDFATLRHVMVDRQIRTFDVTDAAVLDVMRHMPRELFVDADFQALAYSDANLPASRESGRLLTQPLILGRLLKEARLQETDRVLVVGGSSGYTAGLISALVSQCWSLESDAALAALATANFLRLGLVNVESIEGSLAGGAPQLGPFTAIIVDGVVDANLDTLIGQLANNGRLLTIVASKNGARVGKATRFLKVDGNVSATPLFEANATPLPEFQKSLTFSF